MLGYSSFRVDTMPVLSLQAPVILLDKQRLWGTLTTTLDMGLIMEVEELQSFCSTFNKDLVLSLHSVAATELIDGSSTLTGHQVCAFKPKTDLCFQTLTLPQVAVITTWLAVVRCPLLQRMEKWMWLESSQLWPSTVVMRELWLDLRWGHVWKIVPGLEWNLPAGLVIAATVCLLSSALYNSK